jgi:hypothetical protein
MNAEEVVDERCRDERKIEMHQNQVQKTGISDVAFMSIEYKTNVNPLLLIASYLHISN